MVPVHRTPAPETLPTDRVTGLPMVDETPVSIGSCGGAVIPAQAGTLAS